MKIVLNRVMIYSIFKGLFWAFQNTEINLLKSIPNIKKISQSRRHASTKKGPVAYLDVNQVPFPLLYFRCTRVPSRSQSTQRLPLPSLSALLPHPEISLLLRKFHFAGTRCTQYTHTSHHQRECMILFYLQPKCESFSALGAELECSC